MKKVLLASAFAVTMALGVSTSAEAKSDFRIYLGIPHFSFQVGPDYRYRNGYGWYKPRPLFRLSCLEAKREVRRNGFRNVSTVECNGKTYTFRATRNGDRQNVYVNSRTGVVWRS